MEEDWGFFVDIDEHYDIYQSRYKPFISSMRPIPEDNEVNYVTDNYQYSYNHTFDNLTEIMNYNTNMEELSIFKKGQFNNNLVHGLVVLALIRVVLFAF